MLNNIEHSNIGNLSITNKTPCHFKQTQSLKWSMYWINLIIPTQYKNQQQKQGV